MFRVLIVGCGQIAGGFDAVRTAGAWPLTHAGAYARHGGFRLVGCVEPDTERRAAFMRRWGVEQGFASIAAAAAAGPYEVLSLCSPTAAHAQDLRSALALKPRLIFCEKPVTQTVAETAAAVAECAAAGVHLAVNHNRRWAPDIVSLGHDLRAGKWGALRGAIGLYNKGVLNNGSHLVDLLGLLLGPLELVAAGTALHDHGAEDPTVSALLRSHAGVPVTLNAAHASDYAVFELQLITERGLLAMEDGGALWRIRRVTSSRRFKGYNVLDDGVRSRGQYMTSMVAAVQNIHDALTQGAPLASTGETALTAQRLCEAIGRQAIAPPGAPA